MLKEDVGDSHEITELSPGIFAVFGEAVDDFFEINLARWTIDGTPVHFYTEQYEQEVRGQFLNALYSLAAEYNPEYDEDKDFEAIFLYDIIGEHPEMPDEVFNRLMDWFYDNKSKIEELFDKEVKDNLLDALDWTEQKKQLLKI